MLAAAIRGLALPWGGGLALAGNVLLGFTAACVARTRTGEPGAAACAAVVLVMTPGLVPQVARWVRTFPAPGAGGPVLGSRCGWTVLAVCAVAIAISAGGRRLPRWSENGAIPRLPGAVRP